MSSINLSNFPIANIIPNKDALQQRLTQDTPLRIYMGIDPTATQIHLGHAVPLRILQQFAEAGHEVIFLIGDFTALIGDTSDKDSERPALTTEQIQQNFQTYQDQASKILDFSKIKVVYNSEWLSKLTFTDIVKLAQQFSAGEFVSRELIKKRLESQKRVGLHELLYPVMQGYDMYHMDADLQIGGTDQTFNMQAGRTLQKALRNKDTFVITTPFLTGTDGQKMSKTSGNAIWINDTPEEVYGKVMSIRDELIEEYLWLATELTTEQKLNLIRNLPQSLQGQYQHMTYTIDKSFSESNGGPLKVKKQLAHQITLELHNPEAADQAQTLFESTVQGDKIPDDIPSVSAPESSNPIDLLMLTNNAQSRGEARRLIEQGGFKINGQKITDPNSPIHMVTDDIIQAGKRNYFKIK